MGYSLRGHKESDTTEQMSTHTHSFICIHFADFSGMGNAKGLIPLHHVNNLLSPSSGTHISRSAA